MKKRFQVSGFRCQRKSSEFIVGTAQLESLEAGKLEGLKGKKAKR